MIPVLGRPPWKKDRLTHSSILAWRIPMNRGAWWGTVHGLAESDMTEETKDSILWLINSRVGSYHRRLIASCNTTMGDGWAGTVRRTKKCLKPSKKTKCMSQELKKKKK